MVIGWILNYAGWNAIRLLFVTAVINGVLAPPLILIVVLLTRDRAVMGDAVSSPAMDALRWIAFVVMTGAPVGLIAGS